MTGEVTDRSALLADLPLLPRDDDGPVFREPWQAQAFAVVVELVESGQITRDEWASCLGAALKDAEERGEFDTGERYYDHWLTALEGLIVDKARIITFVIHPVFSELLAETEHG